MTGFVVRRLVEALGVAVAACISLTALVVLSGLGLAVAVLIDAAAR